MSRNSYQNKLNLIKSTISELENSSFESSKPEAFPQVNPLKRNIENSAEEMKEYKQRKLFENSEESNKLFEMKKDSLEKPNTSSDDDEKGQNSKSSFNHSVEQFCEYSNTFQMNLDEMYNQILNTKKQKTLNANKNEKTQELSQIKEEIYDINNFSVFTELVVFSKFHLDWFRTLEDISFNKIQVNGETKEILNRIQEKMKVYKFERSNLKGDFFQNANSEKENERTLMIFDAFHTVFKQFLQDPKKFFVYLTTNFVVSFLHIPKNEKDEVQTIALLSGKNKNLCRLLEKEKIQYQILHKHEKMEGISTPQKLMSLENNRNLIYGLEVGPGVELLKITQKNVQSFFNFLMNDNLSNDYSCEILASYHFSNATLSFPRIVYQGEVTLTENEKDAFLYEIPNLENEGRLKEINSDIFHQEHYSTEIFFKKDFLKPPENFIKIFKTKLKGYFFSHHLKDLHELLNAIAIPHKFEANIVDLTKFFKKEIYDNKNHPNFR